MSEVRRLLGLWKRTTRLDVAALVVAALFAIVRLGGTFGLVMPFAGFVDFLALVFLVPFLIVRLLRARGRLLWSLRNRLVVTYLFIAVVPLILVVLLALRTADVLYAQLGIYLVNAAVNEKREQARSAAESIAAALPWESRSSSTSSPGFVPTRETLSLVAETKEKIPGVEIQFLTGEVGNLLVRFSDSRGPVLLQEGDQLWVYYVASRLDNRGKVFVVFRQPVSGQFLNLLTPAVGRIQVILFRRANPDDPPGAGLPVGDERLISIAQITSLERPVPARANWLDFAVEGVAQFEALSSGSGNEPEMIPVFAPFSTRASLLNSELFRVVGNFGVGVTLLYLFGAVFLVLEIAALIIGVKLTRTITMAISDLYSATQRVQSGDLAHRIRIERKDQLGALGESFNEMTNSVAGLIEEQKQRQRLENELSIAQEVQSQLFPQTLPTLPGIELAAVCRPARIVSGDYYDFIPLENGSLGLALADISGKGISAAMLMASLQAALRSQALLDGTLATNTAELVQRLNRHLFVNTSEDRYATLFLAVYDPATRVLRYTNAGHLPPIYASGAHVMRLEEGGTVVGLLDQCAYDQGELSIEAGSVLVAYSDGLVEPENVYGQEFGTRRLEEEILRNRDRAPRELADILVRAAEEWAGTPEQADDMTVIVAKVR